jgi:hypothetical protein
MPSRATRGPEQAVDVTTCTATVRNYTQGIKTALTVRYNPAVQLMHTGTQTLDPGTVQTLLAALT